MNSNRVERIIFKKMKNKNKTPPPPNYLAYHKSNIVKMIRQRAKTELLSIDLVFLV